MMGVQGSWLVPAASCSNVASNAWYSSSIWVGIDGGGTVEQTGTEADCHGTTPTYYAWYEFYPSNIVIINLSVYAGDAISANVSFNHTSAIYTLTLIDKTQGWSKTITGTGGNDVNADWFVESPEYEANPLTDFGTVTFSSCVMTLSESNGETIIGPIANDAAVYQITMVKGSTVLASPSSLSDRGNSFTVTWQNSQ